MFKKMRDQLKWFVDAFQGKIILKKKLKEISRYIAGILLTFGTILVAVQSYATVHELSTMCDTIISEAAKDAVVSQNEAMHAGVLFSRIEHYGFKAEDANGNDLYGGADYPKFPTNQMVVEVEGQYYFFAITCWEIYAKSIGGVISVILMIFTIQTHMNRVIRTNRNAQSILQVIDRSDTPAVVRDYHKNIFSEQNMKKLFNHYLTLMLPAVVFCVSFLLIQSTIKDVGLLVTDGISGVVQHHGIVHSEDTMIRLDSINTVAIDELEPDLTRIPPIVAGGGFHLDNRSAKNYKTLLNGNVVRVTYDVSLYYKSYVVWSFLSVCYFIYYISRKRENESIMV